MEDTPLNEAHYQERRAATRVRQKRYEEAIVCHQRAAEQLKNLLSRPLPAPALLSIRLQFDYHLQQQKLLTLRQIQRDYHRRKQERTDNKMHRYSDRHKDSIQATLKESLINSVDNAESLIMQLKHKLDSSDRESYECLDVDCAEDALVEHAKKSDVAIVDELQDIVQELRSNVLQLYAQLDIVKQENRELKSKLKSFDSDDVETSRIEMESCSPPKMQPVINSNSNDLVFSFSPIRNNERTYKELEDLPPLELPDFDYEAMMKDLEIKREKTLSNFNN